MNGIIPFRSRLYSEGVSFNLQYTDTVPVPFSVSVPVPVPVPSLRQAMQWLAILPKIGVQNAKKKNILFHGCFSLNFIVINT